MKVGRRRQPQPKLRMGEVGELSLLGLSSAGKTTFLGVLSQALARTPWQYTTKGETQRILRKIHSAIYRDGKYPIATVPGKEQICEFEFVKDTGDGSLSLPLRLNVQDISGENVDYLSETSTRDVFEEFVHKSTGIIFLIDCHVDKQRYGKYAVAFHSVFGKMREVLEGRNSVGVALCLTQCDGRKKEVKAGDTSFQVTDEDIANVVGPAAFDHLSNFLSRPGVERRLFGCSSTGFVWDEKSGSYLTDDDGNLTSQRLEGGGISDPGLLIPEGVAEPVVWLLDRQLSRIARETTKRRIPTLR